MSDDLKRELICVKIEKAREAMGEATWCFDGEKYPAAVNRLYYAMYRACLALLVGEDRIPVKHTAVIGLVNKKFVKEDLLPKDVGRYLHRIQTARVEGDYKEKVFSREDVKCLIDDGREALLAIEKFLNLHE
jgi:uncharacterized protein (UPF0332 family)